MSIHVVRFKNQRVLRGVKAPRKRVLFANVVARKTVLRRALTIDVGLLNGSGRDGDLYHGRQTRHRRVVVTHWILFAVTRASDAGAERQVPLKSWRLPHQRPQLV